VNSVLHAKQDERPTSLRIISVIIIVTI
jgi:hypothetical protein